MYKYLSIGVLGLVAGLLTLATPAASQAGPGISISFGYSNGGYYNRYSPSPGYGFSFGYNSHGRHHKHRRHGHHGRHGHHHSPGVIVVPEYPHYTPGAGCHSHGTIIVPHRRHYHVIPY